VRFAAPPLLAALAFAAGCTVATPRTTRGGPAQLPSVAGYDPARELGPMFQDVQLAGVFDDSKTLVDSRPRGDPRSIVARYAAARATPGFDRRAFVEQNFDLPRIAPSDLRPGEPGTMDAHIRALWTVLTRPPDSADAHSSLIPLPEPYVVPGGRFREVYYWDSYFTMLGLIESGRTDLVRDMLDDFAHLVTTVGHIPNGNRTYYAGRSQPPFFAAMVGLYARATDTTRALRYLDALEAEHAYWMDGAGWLRAGQAYRRVVMMPDGVALNRYWDDADGPRPEAYRADVELARSLPDSARGRFYRNVRAAAESGWDFSSRWMRDPSDLRTIETTELIPVDLNALMYNAERTITALRAYRHAPGDSAVAARFNRDAERRRQSLITAAYEPGDGYFYDVRWRTWERMVDRPTLAPAALLFFGVAAPYQAVMVASRLERSFLKPGGFVTTTRRTGQQWDSPNGWAPLEFMAIEGLRSYGGVALADKARTAWLALNRRTYAATGRMMEKYDVVDLNRPAGGGEYATQDGFGWTNGVALALDAEERAEPRAPRDTSASGHSARRRTALKH
jgi:alpha,alpha-trehalase